MTSGITLGWSQFGLNHLLVKVGTRAEAGARLIAFTLCGGGAVVPFARALPFCMNSLPWSGSKVGGARVAGVEGRPCHSSGGAVRKNVLGRRLLPTERRRRRMSLGGSVELRSSLEDALNAIGHHNDVARHTDTGKTHTHPHKRARTNSELLTPVRQYR